MPLGEKTAACSPADVQELTVSVKIDTSKTIYKTILRK